MNDVEINSLLSSVLMQVPGCPEIVAEDAMTKAIRDWYKDTHCWREALSSIATFDNVISYVVTPPACSKIIALDGVYLSGRLIDSNDYVMELPRKLVFGSKLKPGIELVPIAILSISGSAKAVKCDHSEQWQDDWTHGALWYLQMQSAQPWYNPNEAERNRQLFKSAIVSQRIQLNTSNRTGDLRVRNQRFI